MKQQRIMLVNQINGFLKALRQTELLFQVSTNDERFDVNKHVFKDASMDMDEIGKAKPNATTKDVESDFDEEN